MKEIRRKIKLNEEKKLGEKGQQYYTGEKILHYVTKQNTIEKKRINNVVNKMFLEI